MFKNVPIRGPAGPPEMTRTQRKFYEYLSDGEPHTPQELEKHLWDECNLNLRATVQVHIHRLRKVLPPGELIVGQYIGKVFCYTLVKTAPR